MLTLYLWLLLNLEPLLATTEAPGPDYLSKGVIFHKETKIHLAEKFVNFEFLIPFPKYNSTEKEDPYETFGDVEDTIRTLPLGLLNEF